jgi:hypothetical protein
MNYKIIVDHLKDGTTIFCIPNYFEGENKTKSEKIQNSDFILRFEKQQGIDVLKILKNRNGCDDIILNLVTGSVKKCNNSDINSIIKKRKELEKICKSYSKKEMKEAFDNLKVGDVLKNEFNKRIFVLGVCGNVVALSSDKERIGGWHTKRELIENHFKILQDNPKKETLTMKEIEEKFDHEIEIIE